VYGCVPSAKPPQKEKKKRKNIKEKKGRATQTHKQTNKHSGILAWQMKKYSRRQPSLSGDS